MVAERRLDRRGNPARFQSEHRRAELGDHHVLREVSQIAAGAVLVDGLLVRQRFKIGARVQLDDDVVRLLQCLDQDVARADFLIRLVLRHFVIIRRLQLVGRHGCFQLPDQIGLRDDLLAGGPDGFLDLGIAVDAGFFGGGQHDL